MSEKNNPFSSFSRVDKRTQIDLWREWKDTFVATHAGKAGALTAIEHRLLNWDQREALLGPDWAYIVQWDRGRRDPCQEKK